jgi:hypothetical protein
MTVILHEVPGHVQIVDHTQNHVQVKGGSNWDFSRSAVATPIAQVRDPEPVIVMPTLTGYGAAMARAPVATVTFRPNSAVVNQKDVMALRPAKGHALLYVTGHADAKERSPAVIALRRAEAVARRLRADGVEVRVRSVGAEHPDQPSNRRVVVHTDPGR